MSGIKEIDHLDSSLPWKIKEPPENYELDSHATQELIKALICTLRRDADVQDTDSLLLWGLVLQAIADEFEGGLLKIVGDNDLSGDYTRAAVFR